MTTPYDRERHDAALPKLARIRGVVEELRAQIEAELESSRSVSVALTHLDTAELWLARACGEQVPA